MELSSQVHDHRLSGWIQSWMWMPALGAACVAGILLWLFGFSQPASAAVPEAGQVLSLQATLPFQILIPAYLPPEFDRTNVNVRVDQSGPGGEPMAQLIYRSRFGEMVFLRQWVPAQPDLETLANSRPVQTRWGQGWLRTESSSLAVLWVDIGSLRVSLSTGSLNGVPHELLLQLADTLGSPLNE